jgi:hypothetical protein
MFYPKRGQREDPYSATWAPTTGRLYTDLDYNAASAMPPLRGAGLGHTTVWEMPPQGPRGVCPQWPWGGSEPDTAIFGPATAVGADFWSEQTVTRGAAIAFVAAAGVLGYMLGKHMSRGFAR